MATPLPTLDPAPASAQERWQSFLRARETLAGAMRLDVCDGCDSCGGRCTAGIAVTRGEYEAARSYLETLPAAEVARVLGEEKVVPWPGDEESGATVRLCRYRDAASRNCLIYDARPTVCRLMGQTAWLPCPIGAVPGYPEDAPAVWNAYRRFERRTWEEWDEAIGAPIPSARLLP